MQDCNCCGGQTRRDFLATAGTVGAALALSTLAEPAEAWVTCESQHAIDIAQCQANFGVSKNLQGFIQCIVNALDTYLACAMARAARNFSSAVQQAMAWIHAHAGVILFVGLVIGLVVIIGFTAGTAAPIFALAPVVA